MSSYSHRLLPVRCARRVYAAGLASAVLLLLLIPSLFGVLHAQTTISEVVNLYTPVTAVGSCSIDVASTAGLAAGDRVLIIQMTGATIDTSNTPVFGTIVSIGSAGNYELGTIASISGNHILLTRRTARQYDLRGRVQLVRVPHYSDVTVTGVLTAPAWNGATGGVIAIEADGLLRLDADVSASGLGFAGGAYANVTASCTRTDYFYNSRSSYGANKGDGIGLVDSAFSRGRGAAANGGGGGNDHNGGGGGGANRGGGGMGGYEFTECSQGEPATRGIGARSPGYSAAVDRIFMGGGGGGGHSNNNRGSGGAAGGGIILLRARRIEGNGHAIASDGATALNTINGGYDGAGGGGAGGTILLDLPAIDGALAISARGGKGGNTSSTFTTEQHGPGGGGGGGLLWISGSARPSGVTLDIQGGAGGVFTTNNNDPWGATGGSEGAELTGLRIPEGDPSDRISLITASGPIRFCRGGGVTLDAGGGHLSYLWTPGGSTDQSIVATESGLYTVTVRDAEGCSSHDTVTVVVDPLPVSDAGPDLTICQGNSVAIGPADAAGSAQYQYSWSPAIGLDDPAARNPNASPSRTTRYALTVTDMASGCSTSDETVIAVRDARLKGSPGPIDFGLLDGCRSARDTTITLFNEGTEPLTIVERSLTGDAGFELVAPSLPLLLQPGASVKITLRFAPVATGRMRAALRLRAIPCDLEYTVDLLGESGSVSLVADPLSLSFGRALLCQSVERDTTVSLENRGSIPVVIEKGILASPFSILGPVFPITVAAGERITLKLRYAPTAVGRFSGELRLPFVSGSCSDTIGIRLDGELQEPALSGDLQSIDFPPLLECEPFRDTTIMISNRNDIAATLRAAEPGNGFRLMMPMPVVIAPDSTRAIRIRFEPAISGDAHARLEMIAEPCGHPLGVELSGSRRGPAVILPDTIDFGEIVSCREATRTERLAITGVGPATGSARVSAVSFSGPFTGSIRPGDILPNGQVVDFNLAFAPGADGEVTGEIDLTFEPCAITRRVVLVGRRVSVALEPSAAVDLGEHPMGESDTAEAWFVNSGTTALRIDSLRSIEAPFELIETTPTLPGMLLPGERLVARVRYTAGDGESRTTIAAEGSLPCMVERETMVSGRGVAPFSAASVIALPVLEAEPGEHIRIPIMLRSSNNLEASRAERFSIAISFNRTLMIPADAATVASVRGDERIVSIEGIRAAGAESGELGALEMIATLGNAESTPLIIEAFAWIDDRRVSVARIDGLLTIKGICREGGVRLFNADGRLALEAPRPNPVDASTMIEYEVTEPGRTRLLIRNLTGELVATPIDADLDPGRYQYTLDASAIPAGRYLCILQTPTRALTQVVVVR